jgi:hypothetical protein
MEMFFSISFKTLFANYSIIVFVFHFSALPRFDSEPTTVSLFFGQTAVFECGVTATPPASVTWLKDEQPLMIDHRMKVMPSGLLEISDVRLSDRGQFRCNISNEDSSRLSRTAELKINLDTGEKFNKSQL